MGRYLANGVASTIYISKYNKSNKIEDDLEMIKKDLSNYFNLDFYDFSIDADGNCKFVLKKDIFNDNINDLLLEVNELTPIEHFMDYYNDKEEQKQDIINCIEKGKNNEEYFSIRCCEEEGKNKYYYFNDGNKNKIQLEFQYPTHFWILKEPIFSKYKVHIKCVPLWVGWDKYASEDDSKFLLIYNTMKNAYYHSLLSKCFLFFFFG